MADEPPSIAPVAPQAGPAGRAAGIMFFCDGKLLLLQRGDGGDFPRTWGLPGGHVEPGETEEQAARREVAEETGFAYDGPVRLIYDDGQFVNYCAELPQCFPVTICDESLGFVWADPLALPEPTHPGLGVALRVLRADTELAVAELVRDGVLASPYPHRNALMVDLRITGTGMSLRGEIRDGDKLIRRAEHVYRSPEHYLNDEFLRRCNGLPVVLDHPDDGTLDAESFVQQIAGTVILPYIKAEEVWGIARILAADAIKEIAEAMKPGASGISTSPGVVIRNGIRADDSATMRMENGDDLLIEGKPVLLDHIAIVSKSRGGLGVWDKGGPASGINLSGVLEMADEEKAKADAAAAEKARCDAEQARKDEFKQVMDAVSGLSKRLDSMETAKKDAAEADEKAKKDAADEQAKKDAAAADESAKKDSDEQAKKDAAEEKEKTDSQVRADSVYAMHGEKAPRAIAGENSLAYRRRLARGLQAHSGAFKDLDLAAFSDGKALKTAEDRIYADAAVAARNPVNLGEGELREIRTADASGRQISTFVGHPSVWMDQFRSRPRRAQIKLGSN